MLRTHTCGEARASHAGKEVTLAGWVHTRRDHGELTFIDLRDRYGITQVVAHAKDNPAAHAALGKARNEWVLRVRGSVRPRPEGTKNPKLPTGDVEVAATEIEVLNESKTPPFYVNEETEVDENLRWKYRYVDLRRERSRELMHLRHEVVDFMRNFMVERGFWEVETTDLIRSDPTGARDLVVPSRYYPGKFWALPQSPQQLKQILMVGGLDRYFQIARCFRDEDPRADRTLEHSQLDIEMSFVEKQEDMVLAVADTYLVASESLGVLREQLGQTLGLADTSAHYALWVHEFPLVQRTLEGGWTFAHNPFCGPLTPHDLELLDTEPEKAKSKQYDLVVDGHELGGGSIRNHQRAAQERIFAQMGVSKEEAQERFGALLDALDYGAPPHGGIAPGIDRLVMTLAGTENIREVQAFPKTQTGYDPLLDAPAAADAKLLEELGLRVVAKPQK